MSKDPAFLFYPSDFLTGVSDLDMEERGQYITLLCLQHQKGHLSEKLIRLSVGNAAACAMAKFRQDPAGLWYNARLDEEIEKRKLHTQKQSKRASDGWKKRKNDAAVDAVALAAAMPLEDINVNEDEYCIQLAKILNKKYESGKDRGIEGHGRQVDGIFKHLRKTMQPSDILKQAASMMEFNAKMKYGTPSTYITLITNLSENDYIEKLRELDPEQRANQSFKTIKPQADDIGTNDYGATG